MNNTKSFDNFIERRKKINIHLTYFFPNVIAKLISDYYYELTEKKCTIKNEYVGCAFKVLPDEKLLTGTTNGTIKKWNLHTGICENIIKGFSRPISYISILSNGSIVSEFVINDDLLICGWEDGNINIWNRTIGTKHCTFVGHTKKIQCFAFIPNNNLQEDYKGLLVSASKDTTLKIWKLKNDYDYPTCSKIKIQCDLTLKGHTEWVRCVTVLPDGKIVSGSDDYTLKIWNHRSEKCELTLKGHEGYVLCVKALPDGKILSGSTDGTIRLWNPQTGECNYILNDNSNGVYCIDTLPDGGIISGSLDGNLKMWC